jgi:hypothetical protein
MIQTVIMTMRDERGVDRTRWAVLLTVLSLLATAAVVIRAESQDLFLVFYGASIFGILLSSVHFALQY